MARTRQELFPNAPEDAPLLVFTSPHSHLRLRPLQYVAITVIATALIDLRLGGFYYMYALAALLLAIPTWLIVRVQVRGVRRDRLVRITDWNDARGMRPVRTAMTTLSEFPVISGGNKRMFLGLAYGRVIGGVHIVTGRTRWKSYDKRHDEIFLRATLPSEVARYFLGSSLTHIGVSRELPWRLERATRLELESIAFDNTCDLRVVRAGDDIMWRQLFSTEFIDGLSSLYNVEWQQLGDTIVFFAPRCRWPGRVHEASMDTMVLGAVFVIRQFIETAEALEAARTAQAP